MNLPQDFFDRLEYPMGPGCAFLKIAGAEVPQWLRAMSLYEKIRPAFANLKATGGGELTVCGEFYDDQLDFRVLFCFDCRGSANHRIDASGFLAMPQTEPFIESARISIQMIANQHMERVAAAGGTTIIVNQG